jgi:hypothetical protein
MTSPTLVVLAAGMGSRYGGLKQIDPVGPSGEVLLDYSMYDAIRAGFSRVVFVIRKEIEQPFKERFGSRLQRHCEVEYVFQELDKLPSGFSVPAGRRKPWGTGHAVLMASEVIHEPFAVINADDFYGEESYRVLARVLRSGSEDYAMVGFVLRNTLSDFGPVARGVCRVNDENFLEGVVELKSIVGRGESALNTESTGGLTELTGKELVSMNMWGFTPGIFPQLQIQFGRFLELNGAGLLQEFCLPSVVNDLVVAGQMRVKVLQTEDAWFGVTYREDQPRVVESIGRLVAEGYYPKRLWL